MSRIRGHVIVLTAWVSFIISVWLWLFHIIEWQGPVIFMALLVIVAALTQAHEEKNRYK